MINTAFFQDLDLNRITHLLEYRADEPMIFSTGLFFILFLLFIPIYGLLRQRTLLRIVYVALFSLFFYYKSSGWYVLVLLASTTSDYLIGHALANSNSSAGRKVWMLISIAINLAVLSYFKYFNFLGSALYDGLNYLGLTLGQGKWQTLSWTARDIVLPVGISFYTFQTMSYIIDLYRGAISPIRRWMDYVFYVSFFPQLVAGPIVRAKDFIPQIYRYPTLSRSEWSEAYVLILCGLFKKAVISDYIGINFVDRIFDAPALYTGLENLIGVYGYSLQIYCDFSGYSDMAIGIALLLGFRFNINFDSPFQSASITEFWRRWHISLSTWLKDYLYISLGGNRRGKLRTYLNLIITMLLGGLWHGAAWRFILWGAIQGVALAIHKLWCHFVPSAQVLEANMPWYRRVVGLLFTFHLVVFSFIFFRAENLDTAWTIIQQILTAFHPEILVPFILGYRAVFSLIVIGYLLHLAPKSWELYFYKSCEQMPWVIKLVIFLCLVYLITQTRSSDIQPFIYFQF